MLKFISPDRSGLLAVTVLFWAVLVNAQPYPVGDVDGDRDVDFEDLQVLASQWLDEACPVAECEADLNGSSTVDSADFALLAQNWLVQTTTPVISEFMASNGSKPPPNPPRVGDLLDEDKDSSDWIEIYNPTDRRFDVSGWHLTDDRNDLTKWEFPDGIWLEPGQFLIVFASGKNRAVTGSELHTNFQLDADNPEYLALVERDGRTIAHEYAPTYPRQLSSISYGLRQYSRTLVSAGATASYHVPTIEDAAADWTARAFETVAWDAGPTGLGFGFGGVPRAAYNDCVYAGSQYIGQNVTTYGTGNGFAGKTSGPLIDQATGEPMGITVTLTQNGGVNWQSDPGAGGRDCAVGTDAYTTFGGIADMTGVIYYGSAGWWVDVTFTGLDAGTQYSFAASSARCSYDDRLTIYTLTGADTYANASTSGVDVLAENKVRFNSGDNYSQGYVARWTGITASDGSFTVRAEADPSSPEARKAYSFDVFMLAGGFAGSDIQQKMLNNNASLWTRIKFELADGELDLFDTLTLRTRYEDGFIAYLNGVEVARSNFEGPSQWNSSATVNRQNSLAMEFISFDISGAISLLRVGTNILAIHALNDKAGDGDFLILPELIAASSMGVPQYFTQATPGKFNVPGAIDVVADTRFSRERGFYDAPFLVSITTVTEGATIHFTTDGSTPTEVRGQPYAGPIPIAKTTCLRAMAFKPGWISTNVDTQTYIFLADVIRQPATIAGFPASWGGTAADYAMDSRVVNDPQYRGLMRDSLLSLPTISIVTDLNNLFGAAGIYDNSTMAGVAWERPASVEWINPDGTTGFHVNAGLRIYGGDPFRGMSLTRKKSFRLFFKRQYGPAKLDFPMFDAEDAATSFDTIVLRAGANDGWNNWGGANTQYIIDEFMRRMQLALGQVSPHGTFVHLYINGLYWGLYNPTERPMASFCATYYGGDKEEWDALNSGTPTGESSTTTWNAMLSQAAAGLSDNASYQKIQGNNPDGTKNPAYDDLLDIENYIDWFLSNVWGGTGDWPYHNYYVGCRRPPNATGFKFFNWDSEGAIVVWSNLSANVTGASDGGARPYVALRQNDEFRLLFADHVHRHLFNNGPATSQASYAGYKELADQVELAIIAESARWGDQARSTPYTLTDWRKTRDYILGTYMPQRPGIVLEQLRTAGLYPSVGAPVFLINGVLQYGGHISSSSLLMMTAPTGQIYYTLDGSDPRVPIARSAPGAAVTLVAENAPKRVLVPSVANGGNLLGNKPAEFQVTFYQANRTVSSLDIAETVIANPSYRTTVVTKTAPVINYFNTDVGGNFAPDNPFPGTTIGSNVDNFVILVTGTIVIPEAGPWSFGVSSDDGFGLRLTGAQTFTLSYPSPRSPGDTVGVFNVTQPGPYQLRLVFYEQGGGSELELYAAKGSYSVFSSNVFGLLGDLATGIQVGQGNIWFTGYFNDSTWPTGSGGVGYEKSSGFQGLIGKDVGAEMYNTYTTCYIRIPFTAGNAEYGNLRLRVRYDDGFIAYLNGAEVARRNFTGEPAWNSGASAQHPDNAAVVFEEINISDYAAALSYGSNVLAIHGMNSAAGDDDFLISAELVANKLTQGDISPGALEYKNPITLTKSTHIKARALDGRWSALNEAVFAVGPVAENLRITEIMYHPAFTGDPNDQNAEFIELTNVGAESINLNLVRFTEGIQFTFPDIELASGERLLVVKDRPAFDAYYPDCSAVIAGQYEGSLDNAGERIRLEDAISAGGRLTAGRTILDFEYKDGWYDVTDGDGYSLVIINQERPDADSWGLKDSWRPSALFGGSPGYDDTGIVPNPGSVVINEVLTHSHGGAADWIELRNTTGAPINIGGWFLSDSDQDDAGRMKYRIADGTTIEPNGYIVFYEDQHFGPASTDSGRLVPFALSENGDQVVLTSALGDVLTGYRDVEDFDASETDVSFGRYRKSGGAYNFVPLRFKTPGSANAYPMVGPIVINEIMYNPDPPASSSYDNDDFEYIELYNVGAGPVTLYDAISGEPWKFTDGIEFSFPADPPVTVPAGGYLLIVKNPEAFAQRWQAVPADKILGPYEGRLDNSGEKVEIGKPGDVDQFGTRYYIRVDRVNYGDGSHPVGEDLWPSQADGGGKSLTRKVPQEYGNDVVNWKAADPSPGGM